MQKTSLRILLLAPLISSLAATALAQPLTFALRDAPSRFAAIRMTSGDYNGDGKLDVAQLTVAGTVTVMLGRGDGSFDAARDVLGDPLPVSFVITADVNKDQRLDLIATHMNSGIVSVALGRGNGTFAPPLQYPSGAGPGALVAADINGDGKLDLAVANTTGLLPSQPGSTVSVLLGQGNGNFGPPLPSLVLGQRPYSLSAGDFNLDGRADLVVIGTTIEVSILISKGDGTFQPARAAPAPFQTYVSSAVSDFNLDGRPDIALFGGGSVLWILLGSGDGDFRALQDFPFYGFNFVVTDVNGDGIPDAAGVSFQFNVAVVLLGRGDGTFEDQQPFRVSFGPNDIAAGDFNGDGATDFVTCHQSQPSLSVLLNTTPVPSISPNGVVNAASFAAGPLAVSPGEIITIFGRNLGPPQLVTAQLQNPQFISTNLAGTRVLFDGMAAPIVYTRADQLSVVVPYGINGRAITRMQIIYGSTRSALLALRVVPALPGIFLLDPSRSGQAAALNQDGTLNSSANPASKGSILTFFATGEGQTNPPGVDGKLATVPLPAPLLPLIVGIANVGAEVIYAGAAPGLVSGLLQMNIRIPLDAPSGPRVPLVILIGDALSPAGVTLSIQ